MNITIFIGGLSGGGAERVACNLANYLSEANEVTILTLSSKNNKDYYINEKVKRIELVSSKKIIKNNFFLKNIFRFFALRKYLRFEKSDLYITMLPWTINLLLYNRKLIQAPIIISERGDPFKRYDSSKVQKKIMKYLYPKADGFVFQTQDALEYYKEILKGKGIVIPNAINNEKKICNSVINQNFKTFIAAGRLNEQKNYPLMIEAFSKVSEMYPEYKLKIFGEGPLRSSLSDLILELNLSNVTLNGFSENIYSELINSSIFVMSSNYEGMPNALIEAMSVGMPVISTDCSIGGPKYLINNGENGILIETGDKNQLINAMILLIQNQSLANELGKNAKDIVKKLNPQKIYNEWNLYIDKVAKEYGEKNE